MINNRILYHCVKTQSYISFSFMTWYRKIIFLRCMYDLQQYRYLLEQNNIYIIYELYEGTRCNVRAQKNACAHKRTTTLWYASRLFISNFSSTFHRETSQVSNKLFRLVYSSLWMKTHCCDVTACTTRTNVIKTTLCLLSPYAAQRKTVWNNVPKDRDENQSTLFNARPYIKLMTIMNMN